MVYYAWKALVRNLAAYIVYFDMGWFFLKNRGIQRDRKKNFYIKKPERCSGLNQKTYQNYVIERKREIFLSEKP